MSPSEPEQTHPENAPMEKEAEPTFLTRLSSLPLVISTTDYVKGYYEGTKQRYEIVQRAEKEVMEKLVPQVSHVAEVTSKSTPPSAQAALSQGLSRLDHYACVGLDTLERNVPQIREPTDKIMQDGKQLVSTRLYDPLTGALHGGLGTVDHFVDRALHFSEEVVDVYLPEEGEKKVESNGTELHTFPEGETSVNGSETDSPAKRQKISHLSRAQRLGWTLSTRLSSKASHQFQSLKHLTPEDLKALSSNLIQVGSETLERQVAYLRGTLKEGQVRKTLDTQFAILREQFFHAAQRVEEMTPSNIKEGSKSVFLGLSKGISEFAEKLHQATSSAVEHINTEPHLKGILSTFQGSVAFLQSYTESLAKNTEKPEANGEENGTTPPPPKEDAEGASDNQ